MKYFAQTLLVGIVASCVTFGTSTAADWQAALTDPSRPEADRARDAARKPAEVLDFFGIAPGQKVADLLAGSGYYTRIWLLHPYPGCSSWRERNGLCWQ